MDEVLIDITDHSGIELMDSYQLLRVEDGYKIWISTGPISGKFFKDDEGNTLIEEFAEAFECLHRLVKEREL